MSDSTLPAEITPTEVNRGLGGDATLVLIDVREPAEVQMASIAGALRYVMVAPWPSEVLGGIAMGLLGSIVSWHLFF